MLSGAKEELGIEQVALSQTTLEEVFMELGRKEKEEEEKKKKSDAESEGNSKKMKKMLESDSSDKVQWPQLMSFHWETLPRVEPLDLKRWEVYI